MAGAESSMQVTTPRNGHDRQSPAMSAARFERDGRGSMLRLLTHRITSRIVSDAQLLHELPALSGHLLPV